MTRDPVCVGPGTPRAPALALMRAAKFRHLPALDAHGRVVDVLDVVTLGRALFAEQKSLSAVFHQKVQMMFSFAKSFQSRMFSSTKAATPAAPAAARAAKGGEANKEEEEEEDASADGWNQLASEGQKLLVMRPEDTVVMAAKAMISEGVSALLVEDPADGSLAGIVTESDIVRRVVARGADSSATQLCVIMTQSPTTVRVDSSDPADSPMSALSLMFDKKFRHLPMVIGEAQRPHGVLDILRLCQGVFGRKLQENNKQGGVNSGESSTAGNREPSDWIVRGLECFRSRARAAAAAEAMVAGEDEEEDSIVEEEVKEVVEADAPPPLPTVTATATPPTSNDPVPEDRTAAPSAPTTAAPTATATTTTKTTATTAAAAAAAAAARADRFRSYMGKARNKSMKAEKAAQGVDFGAAIKQFGLALHFVALAKKQLTLGRGGDGTSGNNNNNNHKTITTTPAHHNMTMAVRAASIDIRLRRIGAYRIDGNAHEALEDAEAVLITLAEVGDLEAQRTFALKIRVPAPEEVRTMRVELLIELDRFGEAIRAAFADGMCGSADKMFSKQLAMLKQTSNDLYREGSLHEAVTGYTSAMRLLTAVDTFNRDNSEQNPIQTSVDMHVLLANRAACYMRFSPADVDSALQDCERCVVLEPHYVKGWLRLAKYNLDSSHEKEALVAVQRGLEHHPEHAELAAMLLRLSAVEEEEKEKEEEFDKENSSAVAVVEKKSAPTTTASASQAVPVEVDATQQSAEDKVAALRAMMMGLGGV
jgi:CBS domain-containing protein